MNERHDTPAISTAIELEATIGVLLRKNAELESQLRREQDSAAGAMDSLRRAHIYLLTRSLRMDQVYLVHAGAPNEFQTAIASVRERLRSEGGEILAEHVRPLVDLVAQAEGKEARADLLAAAGIDYPRPETAHNGKAFKDVALAQLEMVSIRQLAAVGKEACLRAHLVSSTPSTVDLDQLSSLLGSIEVQAQSSLEGQTVASRASKVMDNVSKVVAVLGKQGARMAYSALPARMSLQHLYDECEMRGGKRDRRPDFSQVADVANSTLDGERLKLALRSKATAMKAFATFAGVLAVGSVMCTVSASHLEPSFASNLAAIGRALGLGSLSLGIGVLLISSARARQARRARTTKTTTA